MRNDLKFGINIRSETKTSCKTCDPTFGIVSQNITEVGWPWNGDTINIDLYNVLSWMVPRNKFRGSLIRTTKSLLDLV
jgi:hypothetical protein